MADDSPVSEGRKQNLLICSNTVQTGCLAVEQKNAPTFFWDVYPNNL